MSGETESNISGWTTDTLHSHLLSRLHDLDRLLSRRMDDADRAIAAALASAEKNADEVKAASDKRFDSVNEFRKALADQTAEFLTRVEYDAAHVALVERVGIIVDRVAALELRLTSRLDLGQGADMGDQHRRTEQRLSTGQILQVAAVAVAVLTFIILYVTKK